MRTPRRAPARPMLLSLLSLGLAIATIALLLRCPCLDETARTAPWWIAIAIAGGFAVAERFVFSVELRRDGIAFSLSEVPSAFAIVFLHPLVAIAVRVIGGLIVLSRPQRPAPHKVAFNSLLFAFEAALAYTIARAIAPAETAGDGLLVIAVAAAVGIGTVVGALVVSAAIACFDGGLLRRLADELRTSAVVAVIGATLAAVTLTPALLDRRLAPIPFLPIAAIWWVLVRHGRLSQRHRDLEDLHGFADVVGRSLRLAELAPAALAESMRLLRADHGAIVVFGHDGAAVVTHRSGWRGDLPSAAGAAPWSGLVRATVFGGGPDRATIAIPVADGQGRLAVLLVGGVRSSVGSFEASELVRADQLATQLAVGLRNALLHADMEHAARHDALTGLPNRLAFDQLVDDELAGLGTGDVGAVLMLDLDGFKEVNDTLGHHMGDEVLVAFASRVRTELAPEDVLARFGGDEFALFARRPGLDPLTDLAKRILAQSSSPMPLAGTAVVVTASIGIATADGLDTTATSLVRRADIAMYAAKRAHAGYELYREELDRRTPQRLAMLGDLREALDRHELEVHYQPKVDLASSTVCGAEALVRWNHPDRGWVNPIDFVRVAEETGLIRELTDQVLVAAIRTARSWRDHGFDLGIAVNLSTLDLLDDALPERVAGHLATSGLPIGRLTLEITESSLMADTPRAMHTIERLARLGVGLSLDDFGTGYSSLTYLRQLPVDELKIDRSFVGNLLLDPHDEVIVRSTVELGHHLGLRVVAEGIETEPVTEHLRSIGCDLGQGYGISRPLPAEQFAAWLASTHYGIARPDAPAMV